MNVNSETQQPDRPLAIDGRMFDLLVDGELDSARQQQLLSRLDATPDGLRRCALAFLEAQAWRRDLRATMTAPAAGRQSETVRDSARRRSSFTIVRHWGLLALGLMMAFGAGWLARPQDDRRQEQAVAPTSTANAKPAVQSVETADQAPPETDETARQLPLSMRTAGMLTLQVDDHGHTHEVRVPVLDASGVDVSRLLEQQPAVRSPAIQALERRGHKVETHRQVLTVDLQDGRKLLLPVDQVDVRAANRVYQ